MAKSEHDRVLRGFQDWRTTMAEGFDAVFNALEAKNYVEACRIMHAVTMESAQAAVTMQGILIKAGQGDALTDGE